MDFTIDWVTIRARDSWAVETSILTNGVKAGQQEYSGCGLGGLFGEDSVQMGHGLRDSERVHLAGAVETRFDGLLQIMPGDLHGQRVSDHVSGALLELDPGWVRQGDPDWASADQELDVHRVGMAGGDGDDDGLELHMDFVAGPAIADSKIVVHAEGKV